MASDVDRKKLAELRATRDSLTRHGFHGPAAEVGKEIFKINRPHLGEVLYLDEAATQPVKVVSVEGSLVGYVPLNVEVGYTHQGNLRDSSGQPVYRVES